MTEYADTIIKSSTIFTAQTLETEAGAVVIRGKEIVGVMTPDEAQRYIGPSTTIFDAGDRLVLPGFNDAHTHFIQNGVMKDGDFTLSLEGVSTKEEACSRIKEFAESHPENKWIMGSDLNFDGWENGEKPTKQLLDELVPDRPAYIASWDMHVGWTNSKGLEAVGYDDRTPDPAGGWLGRDGSGHLTGLNFEPPANDPIWGKGNISADMDRALGTVIDEALSFGVTATGNVYPYGGIPENESIDVLRQFEEEGKLPIRISCFLKMEPGLENPKRLRAELSSEHLRFAGLKQLIDGVSEAHTAVQTEPYADDGSECAPTIGYDELYAMIDEADAAEMSVRLHCIGNGAVKQALDAFEAVQWKNGAKGLHNAIEHIESCRPEDFDRFAKLGVVASMQPVHSVLNIEGYPILLGEKWQPFMWPVKSLIDAGAIMAFGTDAPVWNLNPMESIYAALTRRQPWDGNPEGGFVPDQRISLAQALQAYTFGAAYVENFEDRIGTLAAGKLADVVVMDRNLFEASPEEILDAKPLCTFIDGKLVYEAEGTNLRSR